nr:phage minor capsid protein [Staphylococcus xylosus]
MVSRSNVDIEDNVEIKYLYNQLNLLYKELGTTMADHLPATIINSYLKGLKQAEQLLERAGMGGIAMSTGGLQDLMQAPLHMESISNILSDTLTDLSAAFRTAEQYGHKNLDQAIYNVRNEIANGLITGMTTKQITQRVGEKFGKRGMTAFVTKDGKHLPVDFYAKTVTRSKLQQAENHGHLNRYQERKVKHIEVTGNIPTCGQCAAYRGIVFATEPGDKFPYVDLYRLFPLHPNCQCNFRPYVVKFKSHEDIQQALDKSRMFDPDKDTRTVNEAKKYNATQKAKAAARKKRHSFNKMQSKLGKDGPQSFKEYKNASKKQYHEWIAKINKLTNLI